MSSIIATMVRYHEFPVHVLLLIAHFDMFVSHSN